MYHKTTNSDTYVKTLEKLQIFSKVVPAYDTPLKKLDTQKLLLNLGKLVHEQELLRKRLLNAYNLE